MRYSEINYIKKFSEQLPKIELLPDEVLIQCLDKESFNGKYYIPYWAISNKGRCWSIWKCGWLNLSLWGNKNRYWGLTYLRNGKMTHIKVSWLVANYFCDKTPIDLYGEDGVDVHHGFAILIPDEIKNSLDPDDRRRNCMYFNNADNLFYEESAFHREVIHTFIKGKTEAGVDAIDPNDVFLNNFVKGLSDSDKKSIHSEYREDGTHIMIIKASL